MRRNPHINELQPTYLFQTIQEKAEHYPKEELLNLSIGDISLPLPECVAKSFIETAKQMCSIPLGYGPSSGISSLREKVCETYYPMLSPSEVYISDGAKCDIGRLQLLFSSETIIGVQDPTYPVYSDTALLLRGANVIKLPCTAETEYFIEIDSLPELDVLFLCSPNNPTGHVASKEQLTCLVKKAHEKGFLIIFDTAYADFIQDPSLPKSIYEIDGAKEVAIETSSFSKGFGFTGLRLGWCVIPKGLCFRSKEPIYKDWERIIATFFNGPSKLVQQGGLAALSEEGLRARDHMVDVYLKRAHKLRACLLSNNPIGGEHSPYLWVPFPGMSSWEAFDLLLKECKILTIPGSGFGECGDGFIRFSAFSNASDQAAEVLTKWNVCNMV
jgi:LL-diaminopimelate aminotransferase